MARTMYFESLTDDTVTNVVRFVSKYPRHPAWYRFIESSNLLKLVRAGGLLECTVLNLFNGICSKPLLCFGNGFIGEDTITWLHLPRKEDFELVLPHVERMRIRWLELTRNLASAMTPQLLTVFAKTVTGLSLTDFGYDEHAADIDRIMRFLGPNLVEFNSNVTNRSIVYATREYCTKLKTLRLIHIGGANRVSVSLASVGEWTHLGETLRNLTLVYLWGGNEEDAKLVETSFPHLRSLSVEPGGSANAITTTDPFLNYFRGIQNNNQLEHSDLSILPYSIKSAMRQQFPNARFDAVITDRELCAQLETFGDSLRIVHIVISISNKKIIEGAAQKWTNIEKLIIPLPLRVPMRSVHTLNLRWDKHQDADYLNYLANNSGMLQVLTIRGTSPSVDVWARIAKANNRLRRVRLILQSSINVDDDDDGVKLVAILRAFLLCPELHELNVRFLPERPDVDLANRVNVRNALSKFLVRKTHIRIGDTACLC